MNMNGHRTWAFFSVILVFGALKRVLGGAVNANCRSPLGMQSEAIPDSSVMASSAFRGDFSLFGPQRARLNLRKEPPGYRADRRSGETSRPLGNETWIIVQLPNDTIVTGISTQGYGGIKEAEWITEYSLLFYIGGEFFHFRETSGKNFTGNNDSNTVRHHDVALPVITSKVMLRPLEWHNNVGLRMELYGCKPGYYFLAWLEIKGEIFTLAWLDDTSENHKTWAADTKHEVKRLLDKIPGFLMVKLRRFRLGRFHDSQPFVSAEVEIHCIKETAILIGRNLRRLVEKGDTMFTSHLDLLYPETATGSFPSVDIHLNETATGAKKVYTTSSMNIKADINVPGSEPVIVPPALWEMSMVLGGVITSFLKIANGTQHTLNPRICPDCYPVLIYLRFTVQLEQLLGNPLQDFGFIEVLQPPLVAKIRGDKQIAKGTGEIVLNASDSFDPDTKSVGALEFTWLCKRKRELFFDKNCRHVRTLSQGKILLVDVNRLRSKHWYDFKVVVAKGRRETTAIHQLKVSPSVKFYFRGCGTKVIQSRGMKVIPECEGNLCRSIIRTTWSVFMQTTETRTRQWKRIESITKSIETTHSFVTGQGLPQYDQLKRDPVYKLKATIEISVKNDVISEDHEMNFTQNSAPFANSSGGCFVDPVVGYAVTTSFKIFCTGWSDEDLPLRYEFRYHTVGSGMVINGPNTGISTLTTNLPVGDKIHDYEFPVDINVFDSLGDFTVTTINVKVRDKRTLDVRETLQKIANRESNQYSDYIRSGDHNKACAVAISVLSLVEERRRLNRTQREVKGDYKISKEEARKLKGNIIDEMMRMRINSKERITKVSTVIAMATKERDEISQESQEKAVHLLELAIDFLAAVIANNTEDKSTLTTLSSNLLLGLGNILKISSEDASLINALEGVVHEQTGAYKVDRAKSKKIAQRTLKPVWKLRDYLTVSETETKPTIITSRFISFVLYKESNLGPPEVRNNQVQITVEDVTTDLTLPTFDSLFNKKGVNKTDITTKLVLFKMNPYTWHKRSAVVKSWVMDVVLQPYNKSNLRVAGLDKPIELFLPQNPKLTSPAAVRNNTSSYFVRPSYVINEAKLIQYHKISIPHDRAIAFVKIKPITPVLLRVYVSSEDYPTANKHNLSIILPNASTCQRVSSMKEKLNCKEDPFTFSFTSSDTGNIGTQYIGIHYHVEVGHNNSLVNQTDQDSSTNDFSQKRTRRSCAGDSGRQKRSCIGVKAPPPPRTPPPTVLKSTYNSSTDLNYTLFVTIGSCMYWAEELESWTDDGCKVSPDISSGSVKCLCNHLSAFGGDFFVAPNEIDFKLAFSSFADLGETKNFVVLATVCSILALYFVGLIFTRRLDKKDQNKTIPHVYLPNGGKNCDYKYQISVQTGQWFGSGTTANVGLIMYGEDCHSDSIILNDSEYDRKFFARGSVNTFTLLLPKSLGPLYKIRVWHDNTGENPGWFLQDFVITEITTRQAWHFIANRWLAVEEGEGVVVLEIQRSNKKQTSRFKSLFYSRASKRLADGHLWISVLARSPQSSFTRTQRLSCCISVLFLAMITNAMFYNFGEEPSDTFKIGPLSMGLTQVKIGIQSALIALPMNVIIVSIFRNVKAKESRNTSEIDKENTTEATSRGLPRFFIYVAWILCILAILTSAFFTVLYSMSWGRKISNEWLASITVSFFQDVAVTQPIQVVLIASLLSLLIRKPVKHDPVHGSPRHKTPCEGDANVQPPKEAELNDSRTFRLKLQKMFRSAGEISLFVAFIILLFIVCYGNRNSERYQLTDSLRDIFTTFDKRVNTTERFWNWTRQKLVPGLFWSEWYNGEPTGLEEGFISSGYPFLVGMPRFRQLRVRTGPCQTTDIVQVERCLPYYSHVSEDNTAYNLPGWMPINNISAFTVSFELDELCPRPWRYRTSDDLESLSFAGSYAVYDGGGYVADLGYNAESALGVIDDLEKNMWIDDKTFAVFIEFTVFEPASTLFSTVKYLYERYPTGGTKTSARTETLMIYYPTDPDFTSFYQLCQLLLVILVFILFGVEIVKLYHQGYVYFTHFWSIVEFFQNSGAVGAMVLYFFKAKYTSDFVRRVRENPFQTSSSDYIMRWSGLEIWLLSFVVFIVTIKSLRLLKFNNHVCHLTHTLKLATKHLVSYSLVFTATLMAYTQLGTLLFGRRVSSYSNLVQSLRMLLQRLLGTNMYTNELQELYGVLGQVFTFAYSVSIAMILFNMFLSILNSSYSDVRLTKQGRFPDVELAKFSLKYLKAKTVSTWNDWINSIESARQKNRKWRLRRAKEKYFRVPLADENSDVFFSRKRSLLKSDIQSQLAEECPCPSFEEVNFQGMSFEDLDDIDFVDEFYSIRDVKKAVIEIGTTFYLTKDQWSSTNLDNDEDDRDDSSSLRSERSFGEGSNQSYMSISELSFEMKGLVENFDEIVNCTCMKPSPVDSESPASVTARAKKVDL